MKLTFMAQVKNKKRISIFHNDEYLFSISQFTFVKNNLRNGMEIDNLEEFKHSCLKSENFNYCLNILSKKIYTKKEIYDKLKKRECSENTISEIINELTEKKLISDDDFRDTFIKSRQTYKKQGFLRIKQDLARKGIKLETEDYDKETELENLEILVKDFLNKKLEDKKIINRLLSKGYKFSDILNTIKKYKDCEYENDEF